MNEPVILVADDDGGIRTVLGQALGRAGYKVRLTSNFDTLWQWIDEGHGDCVVSDVAMPGADAFEFIPKVTQSRPGLPVILISAQNTFMTAVKAQEAGAYDYLPKPFDLAELIDIVGRALSQPKNDRPTQSAREYSDTMPLVGRSPVMQELYRTIARLTHSEMPVILSGEGGTGKRLTARVIHDFSLRKHGPFIPLNLAAIPKNQIEAHLFGHATNNQVNEQGAIRRADGGTLYLDEISELPLGVQSRLLRLLMEGEAPPVGQVTPVKIDLRLVCSTSRDLDELISKGEFREDLFYRISVVPIRISPLRERSNDIPDLARHFIKKSELEGTPARHLDNDALQLLKEHLWPGNVRELENLIKRVCILYPQETITASSIDSEIINSAHFRQGMEKASKNNFNGLRSATEYFLKRYFDEFGEGLPPNGVYQRFLNEFEPPVITAALRATNGNQIKASELLGINRNTLRKKIKLHNIRIVKTAT